MMSQSAWPRFAVAALALVCVQCSSEFLGDAAPAVPQIDVCVVTDTGEVCYESLKREQAAELCNGTEECRKPELELDFGGVDAGVGDVRTVIVRNLGGAPLTVQSPATTPGSAPWFVPLGVDDWQNAPITLEQDDSIQFEVRLRGNVCGEHSARWAINSNDAVYQGSAPLSFDPGTPDNPVFLDMIGRVTGPCLCSPPQGTLDFGNVALGRSEVRRFSFESCGDAPLEILDVTIGVDRTGVFEVESTSFPMGNTIPPGEVGSVDVRYTPVALAPPMDAGELHIAGSSLSTSPFFPVFLLGGGIPKPQCQLGAFPDTTNFGQVSGSATRTVRIFNEGDIACRVYDISQSGGSTDFAVTAGAPSPDVNLGPGESFTFEVTFTPMTSGPTQGQFTVTADDVDGEISTLDVFTDGNPDLPDGSCVVDVQPNVGDFGEVSVGDLNQVTFTIRNEGDGIDFPPCNVSEVFISQGQEHYRAGDGGIISSFFLPPGGADTITVTFEPLSEGIQEGVLTIRTRGGDFDLPLWGNALGATLCVDTTGAPVATTPCSGEPCGTVDFGNVSGPSTREVTLTNCGAGTLNIRGVDMGAASAPGFDSDSPAPTDFPLRLAPGESTTVTVDFSPTGSQPSFGFIDVLSTATNAEVARISLRANHTGDCAQILQCNPGTLNFGSQELQTLNTRSIACSNFGTEDLTINNVAVAGAPSMRVVSDTLATVGPDDTFVVQVECQPTLEGTESGQLTVSSSACVGGMTQLNVACTGIVPDLPQCIGSSTFQPIEKWRWEGAVGRPQFDDVWMTPVVINLTDDNADGVVDSLDTPDVIFTALDSVAPVTNTMDEEEFCHSNDAKPAIVVAVSGDDGRELWNWGRLPVGDPADPNALTVEVEGTLAAADIDSDGLPEIVGVKYTYIPPPTDCPREDLTCCIKGKFAFGSLVALEHDGTFKWESERWHLPDYTGENAAAISIGDMDGDGLPEIAMGNAVFEHNGILRFEGITQSDDEVGHGEGGAGHGPFSVMVDIDGDGTNELVAGRTAFDADGSVVWDRPDLGDALATVANMDLDPEPEIVLMDAQNDVWVLDGSTGATLRGPVHISSGNFDEETGEEEDFIPTNPAVGDLDGDGFPEVVISATNFVYAFEHDLTAKWNMSVSDQTGFSGPSTFDFEGDGRAEVVYADEANVYIWSGNDGAEKYKAPRSSRTIADNPAVVDVDNDGHADIVLSMESVDGFIGGGMAGLIAYSNTFNNWVGTRRVWNQHGYHITNISESGIVPAREGAGWLTHNVYRSNVVRCE